jgi:hypothetical protein
VDSVVCKRPQGQVSIVELLYAGLPAMAGGVAFRSFVWSNGHGLPGQGQIHVPRGYAECAALTLLRYSVCCQTTSYGYAIASTVLLM